MQVKLTKNNIELVNKLFSKIKDYKIIKTTYSIRYISKNLKVTLSNEYVGWGLIKLITNLRCDVLKNYPNRSLDFLEDQDFLKRKVLYRRSKNVYKNLELYEYDKDKAYLNTLKKLNLISDKLYEKLLKVHKITRLKVLGSLGTIQNVEYYKNNELIKREIKPFNEITRLTWLNVVYFNDLEMNLYFSYYDKGFYYVDALFIPDKNFKNVEFKFKGNYFVNDIKSNIIFLNDGRYYSFSKVDFSNVDF